MSTKTIYAGTTGAANTVATNAGAADDDTQRLILASDDPAVVALRGGLPAALAANGGLKVEGVAGGVAVPVSAASLPLPSGAATATLQGGGLPAALGAGGGLKVDGSGTALPVSGTVTATVAAKAVLWQAAPNSRGTGLTTELNSLGNGAYSAAGSAIDNSSNGDQYGAADIVLASLNPTAGAYLNLFLVQSLDGSTYEDPPSSTNPGTHMLVATVLVTTGSAAKRIMTPWFRIPPGKFKLVLYNATNVALGASNNTVTIYTSNDEAQ